jgi:hypothetical protein
MFFQLHLLPLQALVDSFCSNQIGAVIGKTISRIHAHQPIVTVETLLYGDIQIN